MSAVAISLVLYLFIIFPLTWTIIRQFKVISQQKENGLQNYRRAMVAIVGSHLIDAIYIFAILLFHLLDHADLAKWFMIGGPFFFVKTLTAVGAWFYYFIYKGSDMSFLTWNFWFGSNGEDTHA